MNKRIILILLCVVLAVLTIGVMAACDRKSIGADKQNSNGELDGEYVYALYPYLKTNEIEGHELFTTIKVQGKKCHMYINKYDILQGEVINEYSATGDFEDLFYTVSDKGPILFFGRFPALKKDFINDKHEIIGYQSNYHKRLFLKNEDISSRHFGEYIYYSDATLDLEEFVLADMQKPFDTSSVGIKSAKVKDIEIEYEVIDADLIFNWLKNKSSNIVNINIREYGLVTDSIFWELGSDAPAYNYVAEILLRAKGQQWTIKLNSEQIRKLIIDKIETNQKGVQKINLEIGNYKQKIDVVVYETENDIDNYRKSKKTPVSTPEFDVIFKPDVVRYDYGYFYRIGRSIRYNSLCMDSIAENNEAIESEILKNLEYRIDWQTVDDNNALRVNVERIYKTKSGCKLCDVTVQVEYDGQALQQRMVFYLYKSTDSGVIDIECDATSPSMPYDTFRIITYYKNATVEEEILDISEAVYDEKINRYIYYYQKDGKLHKKFFVS